MSPFYLPPGAIPTREAMAELLQKYPDDAKEYLASKGYTEPHDDCECVLCEAWRRLQE